MTIRTILIILLVGVSVSFHAQTSLLDQIKSAQYEHEQVIRSKIRWFGGKKGEKIYSNILFIPYLYLNNLDMSQELIQLGPIKDTVLVALKKNPTIANLKMSVNFPYNAIIYDNSLNVFDKSRRRICIVPPDPEGILHSYLDLDADLLFYIWGRDDFFVLIDNKISMLSFDPETKTYIKVEL